MEIEEIYARYSNKLIRIAYRITQNEADSWDILHDAVLEFIKRKPKGKPLNYLIKIIVNKSINFVKKKRNLELREIGVDDSPQKTMEREEIRKIVKAGIKRLEPVERGVLVLKKYENMSHKQISEILDISPENSRIILYRSLEKLKIFLMPAFNRRRREQ